MNKLTLLLALAIGAIGLDASAQSTGYPTKTVTIVIGFAPGGAADYVARSMSNEFAKVLGQPVAVDNRPGAGSSIAAEYLVVDVTPCE